MEEAPVLFTSSENIGTITINRPDVFNSFNRQAALLFQQYLTSCANDDDIRCIVITGSGKAFCAGQDLKEAMDPMGPEIEEIVANHYNPIIRAIREIEKPIVAAVNGVAAGAGANIALACDLVVAKASASFIQAFSKIGLIPDSGGTFMLPRIVGMQRATALMFLGDKVGALEAEEMGMIYKCVDDEEFDGFVKKLSSKLAGMPTRGLGLTKQALNHSMNHDLDQQLNVEKILQKEASETHDYKEGVQAFLEKRKPNFKGN